MIKTTKASPERSKKTGTVYLITDGNLYYVGFTQRPALVRFGQHLRDSYYARKLGAKHRQGGHLQPLHQWLASLVQKNIMPEFLVLQSDATKEDETLFIQKYCEEHRENCLNVEGNSHRDRFNIGKNHGMSKLSEDDVICVRMAFHAWEKSPAEFYKAMAKKLNVDRGSIRNIVLSKTWSKLKEPLMPCYTFYGEAWDFERGSLVKENFS